MSVVTLGKARITALTAGCIRLEYSDTSNFVDDATLFARERPKLIEGGTCPSATISVEEETVRITTNNIRLVYTNDGTCFHAGNLYAEVCMGSTSTASSSSRRPSQGSDAADNSGKWVRWEAGMAAKGNLGGTNATLDNVEGPVELGPGLLSRDGYFLLDDSGTPVINGDTGWVQSRRESSSTVDWYFFGYGLDFHAALMSLMAVSGRVPMPRKYALGSWYSRFWPHTSQEFRDIVAEFRQHGYPLDVIVLDMDWHRRGTSHWTGWSWNRQLLPDAEDLLKWFHDEGLHVTLNLHPADGVGPQEDAYRAFMGEMDPSGNPTSTLKFDAGDQRYMNALFKHVHDPLQKQGVDFWWLDWQQDKFTRSIPELSNLTWLNELYFRQSKAGGLRGLQFSRWGGWGDHTKPIHFSGDASTDWPMLAFQVPFTATASNVGCFFWSHDIGGHLGPRNEECYARWAQFSATSATMRIHSSRSERKDCRPWKFQPQVEASLRVSWQLRHSLMPYIYSAVFQCHEKMRPLIRPMYLDLPDDENAYQCPSQFCFGDSFIVAPIVSSGYGQACLAQQSVWLPSGIWYNYLTCERLEGGRQHLVAYELDEFPIFIRGGHLVPLQPPATRMCAESLPVLHVRFFPGSPDTSASCMLYEDDGETLAYESGERALTQLTCTINGDGHQARIEVGPTVGSYAGQLKERSVVIELCACAKVSVQGAWAGGVAVEPVIRWHRSMWMSRVVMPKTAIGTGILVVLQLLGAEEAAEDIKCTAATRRVTRVLGRSQSLAMASLEPPPSDVLRDCVLQGDLTLPVISQALAACGIGLRVVNEGLYLCEERLAAYLYWPQATAPDSQANGEACEIHLFFQDGHNKKVLVRATGWKAIVEDGINRIEAHLPLHGHLVRLSWKRNIRIGQIRSRLRDRILQVAHGEVGVAARDDGSGLSQWELAEVHGERNCVRIRLLNGTSPAFLHTQNGKLMVGAIQTCQKSAKWNLDDVNGQPPLKRLRQNDAYLHIEHGKLEMGPIQHGWWSMQWNLPSADTDKLMPDKRSSANHQDVLKQIFYAILNKNKQALEECLDKHLEVLLQRSKDGRGALWWAWEHRNAHALQLLTRLGENILSDEVDKMGKSPRMLGPNNWQELAEAARKPDQSDKVVYFIRHGYSEAQAAEADLKGSRRELRFRDATLHKRGIDQAMRVRGEVLSWGAEYVYSSPLRRALQTTALLFKDSEVPIEICSRLRELPEHYPENVGLDPDDLAEWMCSESIPRERALGVERLSQADTSSWDPQGEWQLVHEAYEKSKSEPGAPTIEQLMSRRLDGVNRRLWKWWSDMLARKERKIVVVAHYAVIKRLFHRFNLSVENCSVYRVPFVYTSGRWLHGIPSRSVERDESPTF